MSHQSIFTTDAPVPLGAYVQGVQWEDLIVTTGQVARDPAAGGPEVRGDLREQTRQALRNIQAILRAAGSDLDCVLKTTCFLNDIGDFTAFNEVYGEFFPVDPPARSTIGVALVPPCLVMIEVIATRR